MTASPLAPTAHPVLIETTRTYLVWIEADTPAAALRAAQKDPEEFLGGQDPVPVDASTDTAAVTEDTAAWLDLDSEAYQRLDDYFATASAFGADDTRASR